MQKIIADTETYYIAYSQDKSTIHAGKVLEGNQLVTAQPVLEKTFVEADWIIRAEEIGYVFPEEVLT